MRRVGNGKSMLLASMIGAGALLGALVETSAGLLGLYVFQPWWVSLVIVFAAFGLGLGTLTFVLRSRLILAALFAALFAFAAEMANARWLEYWSFDGWILDLLPDPFLRAGVLSLPVLFAPFIVQALGFWMRETIGQRRSRRGQRP